MTRTDRVRRTLVWCWPVTALGVVTLLAVAGGARWWYYIAAEQTPMTWAQSVTLVLCMAACSVLAVLHHSPQGPSHSIRRELPANLVWWVMAIGFGALALDERFALHERLRDRVLAPRGARIAFLPWIGPGDFVMLAVGIVGLVLLPMVYRTLAQDPLALKVLLAGVGLSILAITMDSFDPARMSLGTERLEQTVEECLELAAGLGYLTALGLIMLQTMRSLIDDPTTNSATAIRRTADSKQLMPRG